MATIPRKLARDNTRFIFLREKAVAGADGFTPPTDAAIYALTPNDPVQIVEGQESQRAHFYWNATTPGGTATISLWLRDGLPGGSHIWLSAGSVVGLAPGVLASLELFRSGQCFFLIGGAPTGTDMYIRGYGYDV